MEGRLVVENNTGHALREGGCGTLFQLELVSNTYQPHVGWDDCLDDLTIPVGTSSYPVWVVASYNECHEGGPWGAVKACLPNGPPPLAPGDYDAELFQAPPVLPPPPGIPIQVLPAIVGDPPRTMG
jgi:hypothetical protein